MGQVAPQRIVLRYLRQLILNYALLAVVTLLKLKPWQRQQRRPRRRRQSSEQQQRRTSCLLVVPCKLSTEMFMKVFDVPPPIVITYCLHRLIHSWINNCVIKIFTMSNKARVIDSTRKEKTDLINWWLNEWRTFLFFGSALFISHSLLEVVMQHCRFIDPSSLVLSSIL